MASSVPASKCNFLVFVTCVLVICDEAIGITTIHHDKPPESRLSISRMPNRVKFNSTIPPGERRKRLLPYYNFYVAQDINQQSKTKPQQYQTINFRPAGNYFLETSPPQKFRTKVPQQLLHNRQKIQLTPFLDSNALAGPFVPIIRKPEQNHGEYQTKQPDYASIYENMSKLKFLPPPESYNNYRVTPQRGEKTRYEGEEVTARPEPVTVKTIIQTYKPTHIDVTSEGERYSQKANLESNGDKGVYRSEMAYQHFSPPVTSEEYKQYRKDQDRYVPDKSKYAQENIRYVDVKAQYAPENLQYAPEKSLNDPDKIQFVPADVRYVKAQYTPEKVQYVPILKYVTSKPQYIPNNLQYHQEQIQYVSGTTEDTQRPNPTLLHHQKLEEVTENPAPIVVTISPRKPYQPSVYKYEPIHSNIQNFQHLTVSTTTPEPSLPQPTELPETSTTKPKTLNLLLKQLQESNTLPQTLTPDNVDNSIKTLVKILDSLKKQQSKFTRPIVVAEEEEYDGENEADGVGVNLGPDVETHSFPAVTQEGGTPGKPGVDYPALSTIPKTSFNCKTQRYKGFFGDPDTNCQVWHYCDLNGGQASFLCPNGTIFSQVALTCDWWFNVKCASTPQLYVLNERLYKYILPLSPKFPEDYSGPLVDKYLALKFQEMEEKMRKEKKGKVQADSEEVSKEEENEEKEISTEEDEYVTTVEAETTK